MDIFVISTNLVYGNNIHIFPFHSLFLSFITFINQFTKIFDKNNKSKIYLFKRVQTKLILQ